MKEFQNWKFPYCEKYISFFVGGREAWGTGIQWDAIVNNYTYC